jgi:hypothetical protein
MYKSLIPALTVALLGNSIATAQYFGAKYPASSEYRQPARPIRIAQVTDNERPAIGADSLDELDSLDALDSLDEPTSGSVPQSVLTPPLAPPQTSDVPGSLQSPASPGAPEPLELPTPAEVDRPASPSDLNAVQPEISAQDLESLNPAKESSSIVESSTAPLTPLPGPINFDEAFQQQQRDQIHAHQHSASSQYYGAASHMQHGNASFTTSDCGCSPQQVNGCGSCLEPLPYRTPLLPPSNSFHGHFKSNPCYYDLWANYPAEAAAACACNRAMLAPTRKAGCRTCELVDPRPCR